MVILSVIQPVTRKSFLPVRINNTVVGALDIDSPAFFPFFSSEDEL
uniref:Uncharacterized protein n=1 Tax=Klebsiella pneumoniae TaxID=573 RepID=A0A8B0SRK2_KLEPN|nr:hypothetical protein [Klebsiella pneumoniae]